MIAARKKRNRLAMLGPLAGLGLMLLLALVLAMQARAQDSDVPFDDGSAEASLPALQAADGGLIPTFDVLHVVRKAGLLIWPIVLCSVITLVFVFERMISLRRSRVIPKPFVKRFFHQLREGQLDRAEALSLCEQNGSPIARVLAGAAEKWGRPAVEVEQAVLDAGERAANGLRSYLRVFNGVSTISPLLGLLGTVFGMIKAFNAVAEANSMGRVNVVASGISEALLTTAAGLAVAIPALIAYWVFVAKVDQLLIEIDAIGQDAVKLISSDGLGEIAASRGPRTRKREPAAPNVT
ncbi:MAG: MotA/TolQ/ExbB proton channel family protein [Pirellulales bacterium]